MSQIPKDLRYNEEHEYVQPTDEKGVYQVGITDYAQGELGDIVFVELPDVGDSFEPGAVFGTIEAVKAVSELYCPVGGEVIEVNEELDANPQLVNSDPYGEGWMVRIRIAEGEGLDGLLDADGYAAHVGEG